MPVKRWPCKDCGRELPVTAEYWHLRKSGNRAGQRHGSCCLDCARHHQNTPESKAKQKAYRARPEVKARIAARQKEEKLRRATKRRHRAYHAEYRKRPEVRARKAAQCRESRAKLQQQRQELLEELLQQQGAAKEGEQQRQQPGFGQ